MTWTKVSACINIQIFKILSSAVNSNELISYRQIKYVYFINKILKLICHCRASLRRKRVYLYIIFYITKVIIDRYSLSLSLSLYTIRQVPLSRLKYLRNVPGEKNHIAIKLLDVFFILSIDFHLRSSIFPRDKTMFHP